MIRTPFTRLLLLATMCICWAQTFIDGSSKAIGPIPAFATALTAYVGSSTEAAVVAEIHKISEHKNTSTWLPQPGWMKKREEKKRMKRQGQPLIELIKAHRLRFHEERKAQVELANPL
ncbi:hypothetical protein B0H16DRAFT_1569736 [Mycena metata]|uniref:Secreted protein n=1 Tax=Mycena metata TaxID=1033252 RepID=A0AAD7IBY0_9AGAR|nr:hypothetical protein B0H16DRAFT_1569736 [Mycena metata]